MLRGRLQIGLLLIFSGVCLAGDGNITSTVACAAGSFKNGASCSLCSAGKFTDTQNQQTSCYACAAGSYATENGATVCQSCAPCVSPDEFLLECGGSSAGICSYCDSSV